MAARERGIGPVPEGLSEGLASFLEQLRRVSIGSQQMLSGRRGLPAGSSIGSGSDSSGGTGGGTDTDDEPDLTPPPTPIGTVLAGLDFVGITTDAPTFTEGHGYGRTLVYGAKYVGDGTTPPLPTFTDAVLVHEFVGQVGTFATEPATQWHIWLKWRSADGVLSVSPDGGANGHQVTTGQDVTNLLSVLAGQITESELYSSLATRLDGIEDNAAAIGVETTTRQGETGDLFAQYTVKVDVNGYVSGFGLASTAVDDGTPTSEFIVRADKFAIASPSGPGITPAFPFTVLTSGTTTAAGEVLPAGVYMEAAYIKGLEAVLGRFNTALITNAMIVELSASKITAGSIAVGEYVQSSNYVADTSGFRINGGGSAEFNDVMVRGTVYATDGEFDGQVTIRDTGGTIVFTSDGDLDYSRVGARPASFRVCSQGYLTTTAPIGVGIFNAETNTSLAPFGVGYNIVKINRSTGVVTWVMSEQPLNTGTGANAAAALNAIGSDHIVVVFTYDEPWSNRTVGGLADALYRCGGSRAVFMSSRFNSRAAYTLIGIPGINEGNGFEVLEPYDGANSWTDVTFTVINGNPVFPGGTTPPALADYGYTGDLNATNGATFGANISGQITSANVSTYIASAAIQTAQIASAAITNALIDTAAVQTANILDANVTTLKVAGNAITAPAGAKLASNYAVTSGAYQTVASVSLDAGGSPVWVTATVEIQIAIGSSGQHMVAGIFKDGSQVVGTSVTLWGSAAVEYVTFPISYYDTSGATGSHTYTLRLVATATGHGTALADSTTLFAIGVKR